MEPKINKLLSSKIKLRSASVIIPCFVIGSASVVALIDSVVLYGLFIIALGFPILFVESKNNLPFICFGSLFWIGNVLTRVLAAWIRTWLSAVEVSSLEFQTAFVGMTAFTVAYFLILSFTKPGEKRWLDPTEINLNWIPAILVSGGIAFFATVGYNLVGNTPRGIPPNFNPIFNVVGGLLEAIRMLPAVFLALSIVTKSWKYSLILFVPWVSIFIGPVLQSSRGILLMSVLIIVFVWSFFQPTSKKLFKVLVLFFVGSVYIMLLLGYYRGEYSKHLSISSRISRFAETFVDTLTSKDYLQPQALRVAERLYYVESIELMNFAEQNNIRDPWYALDQLVYVYVPKFLYPEKGSGLRQDLLYRYKLVPVRHEASNVTVIMLADAFFRWGVNGVLFIYALTGVILALLAKFIWAWKDTIMICVLMGIIGYHAFYSFSLDVYNLFTWWLFEIPKLIILSTLAIISVKINYFHRNAN